MKDTSTRPLGNRPPKDDAHIKKYPFATLRAATAMSPAEVDKKLARGKTLELPPWYLAGKHDQGWRQGSCVGHATTLERAITNRLQRRSQGAKRITVRYDPIHVWRLAKSVDEWDDTRPDDDNGTSARAAYDILRDIGPVAVRSMQLQEDGSNLAIGGGEADIREGIVEVNRWCTSVDEMREAIAMGRPIAIGIPWLSTFDSGKLRQTTVRGRPAFFMPDKPVGTLRGYHEICVVGADDTVGAFRPANSWGGDWPIRNGYLPYTLMDALFDGSYWTDAVVVVDR